MGATLLTVLVPVFFVLAVGAWAGLSGKIDRTRIAELNTLVMEFLIPAALFVATATTPRAVLAAHVPFALAMAASMLGTYGLVFVTARRLVGGGTGETAVVALVVAFPNLAAVGLPLTRALFGPANVVLDATGIALGAILLSPMSLLVLERQAERQTGSRAVGPAMRRALTRPVVVAPILGLLYALSGLPLPALVRGALGLLGEGAGGGALFVTGVILSSQRLHVGGGVALLIIVKNALQPAVAFAAALLLNSSRADARVVAVLASVPCGFFGILFGLRYGISSRLASAALLGSTIAAVVTLPVVILVTSF